MERYKESKGLASSSGRLLTEQRMGELSTQLQVARGETVRAQTRVDEINAAFAKAAKSGPLKDVLSYTEAPIVSSDITTDPSSCTFDAGMRMVQGKMAKINGWYDNEWGYSNRLVDLVDKVAASL